MKTKWLALLLVVFLAGCGWHLRGVLKLPPQLKNTYIQSDAPNSPFTQVLTRLLIANHINVVKSPQDANAILVLSDVNTSNALTSLSGGAEAGQYTMYGSVTFSVTDAKTGAVFIPPRQVENTRTFDSNSTQALSAQSAINNLMVLQQNQLAQDILNQLTHIKAIEPTAS